jgi:hypothetical protein
MQTTSNIVSNEEYDSSEVEICGELIPANPTVWSAEVRSANGDIDAVNVTASMIVAADIGTQFVCSGGGNLWSESHSLTVIYRTKNIVVCEEAYDYSETGGRKERQVSVKLFQIS